MSSDMGLTMFELLERMRNFGCEVGKVMSMGTRRKELHEENMNDNFPPLIGTIMSRRNQNEESSRHESGSTSTHSLKNNTSNNSLKNCTSTNDPSSTSVCGICFLALDMKDSLCVDGCDHFYCRQCIVKFIEYNLQNNVTSIACPEPGCRGVLTPGYCRPILPNEIYSNWVHTLFDQKGQCSHPGGNNTNTDSVKTCTSTDGPSTFICDICVSRIDLEDSFNVQGCNHIYCQQCIVNYVVSELKGNTPFVVCPEKGCTGVLIPEYCHHFLPEDIFDMWVDTLWDQNGHFPNPISNSTNTFVCDLCVEQVDLGDSFDIKGCNHFYCRQCIVNFIMFKLQEDVAFILCPEPGCKSVLDPEYCYPILPSNVKDMWDHALHVHDEQSFNPEINSASTFVCDFCIEPICLKDSFNVKGCSHFYCQQCIVNFVVSKLQDNVTSIKCPEPGCRGMLDPEYCRSILPNDVFDRWGKSLVENLIKGSETLKEFYCPFKECSALLIDDGNEVIQQSECPHCRKLFCAQCKVPWHAEIDCVEFQKLNEGERENEDIMLRNLAQTKNWRRCPSCKYYVARESGCSYIRCRCGFAFCYHCGIAAPLDSHTRLCPSCNH